MKTILLLFTLSSNFYGVSAILVLTLLFLLNRKRFLFASSSSTPSLISSGSTNSNLRSLFTFHSPLALCQFNFILFACFTFQIQLALMLKLGLFRAYNSTSQIFTLFAFVALQSQQNLEILFFFGVLLHYNLISQRRSIFFYSCRTSTTVTDADLKFLMEILDENLNENDKWEDVIDKRNQHICYKAKSSKPKVTHFMLQLEYTYYDLSWLFFECIAPSFSVVKCQFFFCINNILCLIS